MTSYSGSDPNIQRKARRAYKHLKDNAPDVTKLMSGSTLDQFLKAIFIALDEDYKDNTLVDTGTGEILIDETTPSTLDPIPYDKDT